MTIIQRWLVFAADAQQSYINWHLARNDVNGYMKGVPSSLQELAAAESWTLPHIYEETVNVETA
jgi:hypothetical protein